MWPLSSKLTVPRSDLRGTEWHLDASRWMTGSHVNPLHPSLCSPTGRTKRNRKRRFSQNNVVSNLLTALMPPPREKAIGFFKNTHYVASEEQAIAHFHLLTKSTRFVCVGSSLKSESMKSPQCDRSKALSPVLQMQGSSRQPAPQTRLWSVPFRRPRVRASDPPDLNVKSIIRFLSVIPRHRRSLKPGR